VRDRAIPEDAVFIGELGLGGELRSVTQLERRLAEAARLHFATAHVPGRTAPRFDARAFTVLPTPDLATLVERIGG
jgi:DNA repair protein RadA/Sms